MTQPPYPGQHPYPGQPPQTGPIYPQTGPSNPGYPPQPHNQPYPPQPPPPTPTSKTKTGIIITMSVIIIALAIIVVYLAYHEKDTPTTRTPPTPTTNTTPTPTPIRTPTLTRTPTPGRGWTLNGDQLTGPTMTAKLPPGWRIGEENGDGNDGDLRDPNTYNLMFYWAKLPGGTAEEVCKTRVARNRVSQNDPAEPIPEQTWGGKPVVAYHLTVTREKRKSNHNFYCLDNGNNTAAVLHAAGWDESKEPLRRDTKTILSTWQWK